MVRTNNPLGLLGFYSGPQLVASIAADRDLGRDKDVWRALKGSADHDIAASLLIAGISVAEGDLGTDRDGEKNLRDQALWIGRNLGRRGEIALRGRDLGRQHAG